MANRQIQGGLKLTSLNILEIFVSNSALIAEFIETNLESGLLCFLFPNFGLKNVFSLRKICLVTKA